MVGINLYSVYLVESFTLKTENHKKTSKEMKRDKERERENS